MNLITDQWIPVRPLNGGGAEKISLRDLLCGEKKWELCLPRDDMELAAIQLLICITQTLITPKTAEELRRYIAKPMSETDYATAIRPYDDWFQLDHPKFPFMQVRGVAAKDPTPMDKLLAGLTGATNCCFINDADLAARLCPSCTTIALFNQATCTPGFGGGFKDPLRSGTPITTLVQGPNLRQTVWLNILSENEITRSVPWHDATKQQKPTWIDPIKSASIPVQSIGFIRGLFWQPAHIELLLPESADGLCSCCGVGSRCLYTNFNKAKFSSYSIIGTWPHPHSARVLDFKKTGDIEQWFTSFTTSAPAWTQLNRFVEQVAPHKSIQGYEPAAVILQTRTLYGQQAQKLHLAVGGYRRNKASIVGRCHEVFTLNPGWNKHANLIGHLVSLGLGYKDVLTGALYLFCNGLKDKKTRKVIAKGLGEKIKLYKKAEVQFYRTTENTIQNTLSCIDFDDPRAAFDNMRQEMERNCRALFNEFVRPYLNDPELVRTMAVARKTLNKKLLAIKPQQGGIYGTAKTP